MRETGGGRLAAVPIGVPRGIGAGIRLRTGLHLDLRRRIPRPVGRQGPGVPRMPDNPLVRASGTTFSTEASVAVGRWVPRLEYPFRGSPCDICNTRASVGRWNPIPGDEFLYP